MTNQSPAPVAGDVEALREEALQMYKGLHDVADRADEEGYFGEADLLQNAANLLKRLAALHPQPAPVVAVDEVMERAAFVAEAKRRGWTPGDFMLGAYAGWLAARSAPAVAEKVPLTVYLDEEMSGLLRQTIGDDGEPSAIRLEVGDGHSGWGLYVSLAEYPEEGAIQLAPIGGSGSAQEGQANG